MKRSSDRILTTHVGSLVRPPEVIAAMQAIESGQPYDAADLQRYLERGVAEVVRQQAEVGVDVVSDGEFGKAGWTSYATARLGGLERRPLSPEEAAVAAVRLGGKMDHDRFGEFFEVWGDLERSNYMLPKEKGGSVTPSPSASAVGMAFTGPITYKGSEAVQRDIANFKAALAGISVEEAFLPVAAPASIEASRRNAYYASDEEFLFAVGDALHEEYQAIVDAGLLLQVDDAWLPMRYAQMMPDPDVAEYNRWAELRIEATNHALRGIPEDRVRYHVCWGSQNVPHMTDAPLSVMLPLIMKVNAQAYSIESANPRHEHEWTIWQETKLPDGKIIVPGVISHATNIVEHPELVAQRIMNFANLVGRENVIASSDCGFSQNWNLVRVHPTIQWAKLEALAQGAAIASKRLWGR
ncbi:MAG: cobalamin-independent methionine synthase II family protein [Dehalococcoidia bacterium]